MPRKAFVSDLQDAIREIQIDNLSNLAPGEEDGTITFKYHLDGDQQGTTIQAIVPGKIIRNNPFFVLLALLFFL